MGSIERWAKRRQSSGLSCWLTSGNIDAEFLQPGPDLLEEKGPGCHHIAFKTKNLTERNRYLEDKGHRLLQRGEFDGGHGRYAYYDTVPDLGVMIELLEFDSDKEVQPKQA
ncbi:VOC family protein [Rhizobium laguerreae]|uniref:VOC family protein n=1 Tax=Rhizobium laguerreae TaxID=1076926 RepID=UPI001FE88096|nr:VOC family protein [Rhizobium laguerreae]